MANTISTIVSHISRALDVFESERLYLCVGRQSPWPDELNVPLPDPSDVQIEQPVGYKKVSEKYMVVRDDNGTLRYRDSSWRIVSPVFFKFQVVSAVSQGSTTVTVQAADPVQLSAVTTGTKIMLQDGKVIGHTAKIVSIAGAGNQRTLTIETGADKVYPVGTICHWGLIAETCRTVFLAAWINFDEIPPFPYRVVGFYNRLVRAPGVPESKLALLPSEVADPGVLEVVQYRRVVSRDIDQREYLSVILEF